MSTVKAQERLQAAFDRLEAAARALKDRAQGEATTNGEVAALRAELDKARHDNTAMARVTESASGRIDHAVARLRAVLDG